MLMLITCGLSLPKLWSDLVEMARLGIPVVKLLRQATAAINVVDGGFC